MFYYNDHYRIQVALPLTVADPLFLCSNAIFSTVCFGCKFFQSKYGKSVLNIPNKYNKTINIFELMHILLIFYPRHRVRLLLFKTVYVQERPLMQSIKGRRLIVYACVICWTIRNKQILSWFFNVVNITKQNKT